MTIAAAEACALSNRQSSVDVMLLVLSSVFVLFLVVDSWIAGVAVAKSQLETAERTSE